MPLLLDQSLPENTRLLVWDITENTDWLKLNVTLNKEEEILYNTFTHEPRRKQWLTVRLLLQHYFLGKTNHHIHYDEFNKPYFKESKLTISVSHSHQFAGIIISSTIEPGLDIEHLDHRIEKIKDKFLSNQELQQLNVQNTNEQLHVYWCAKEVMYKIYGRKRLEFKDHLKILPFNYSPEGKLKGLLSKAGEELSFEINYRNFNGYMIAWGSKVNV
jgi:4'-phosphopantetheinyl transferase